MNSGGIAFFKNPLYVASGFSISYDVQFGSISTVPADGYSLVFSQSSSASSNPAVTCTARGGVQCFTSINPRFAVSSNTYAGGATSNYFSVGVGTSTTGIAQPSALGLQFLSTSIFGTSVVVFPGDVWSHTVTFQPGGGSAFSSNQVTYTISRSGASQTFTAQLDINAAISAAPALGSGLTWLGFVAASGGSTEENWVTNVQV